MKTILPISKKLLSKNNVLFKKLNEMISNNIIKLDMQGNSHLYYKGDDMVIEQIIRLCEVGEADENKEDH